MIRYIDEGQIIPKWWRVAYLHHPTFRAVIAPIGLHILIRWGRRMYEWSFRYRRTAFDEYCARIRSDERVKEKQKIFKSLEKLTQYWDYLDEQNIYYCSDKLREYMENDS